MLSPHTGCRPCSIASLAALRVAPVLVLLALCKTPTLCLERWPLAVCLGDMIDFTAEWLHRVGPGAGTGSRGGGQQQIPQERARAQRVLPEIAAALRDRQPDRHVYPPRQTIMTG